MSRSPETTSVQEPDQETLESEKERAGCRVVAPSSLPQSPPHKPPLHGLRNAKEQALRLSGETKVKATAAQGSLGPMMSHVAGLPIQGKAEDPRPARPSAAP